MLLTQDADFIFYLCKNHGVVLVEKFVEVEHNQIGSGKPVATAFASILFYRTGFGRKWVCGTSL